MSEDPGTTAPPAPRSDLTPASLLALSLSLSLFCIPAFAGSYYVAPPGTEIAGTPDGSAERPFASVGAALKSPQVKGGDTLLLKPGDYGALKLYNYARTDGGQVTIRSEEGNSARFDNISLQGTTSNLTFSHLTLQPDQPDSFKGYLVQAQAGTSALVFENLQLQSGPDAAGFMDWDLEHWQLRRASGIRVDGNDTVVRDNTLTAVYMGITATGDDVQVIGNLIDGYDGDGLRGIGDNNLFRGNRVFNAVKTDGNHDDGFQSFASNGKPVTGLVLDSNVIVDWTGDPDHPLRSWALQGIGLFDGFYDDLTIVNNLVVNQFNHGITVMGARGAQILNNTVVKSPIPSVSNSPKIRVYATKGGIPSTDVTVANNLAQGYDVKTSLTNRVVSRNNSGIGAPALAFEDPLGFDFRPRAGSGYIDSAAADLAPDHDLTGQPRPRGAGPDRGAYELQGDNLPGEGARLLEGVVRAGPK